MNNVFAAIQKLLHKGEEIPDNFYTVSQLAKQWGVSDVHARRKIRELIEVRPDLVEKGKYKVQDMNGRHVSVTHFNIKIKAK
jgi:Fic family protein